MRTDITTVMLAIGVAVALGFANCGIVEVRSLEAENAILRAQLNADNNVREAALSRCEDARVMLEMEGIVDRTTLAEVEDCPAFDKCYEQCIIGVEDEP